MMRFFQVVVWFIFGIATAMLAMLALLFRTNEITTLMVIQGLAPIAILFSGCVALLLYRENITKNRADKARAGSAAYLSEAKSLLERAFTVFAGSCQIVPENRNMVWRTTALLLIKGKAVGNDVSEHDHIEAWQGHKQYYALQFHRILWENVDAFEQNYFAPEGTFHDTSAICRKSIAIIFEFAHSVAQEFQTLDAVDAVPIFASPSVPADFLGVEAYICQFDDFWQKVDDLRRGTTDS